MNYFSAERYTCLEYCFYLHAQINCWSHFLTLPAVSAHVVQLLQWCQSRGLQGIVTTSFRKTKVVALWCNESFAQNHLSEGKNYWLLGDTLSASQLFVDVSPLSETILLVFRHSIARQGAIQLLESDCKCPWRHPPPSPPSFVSFRSGNNHCTITPVHRSQTLSIE